MLTVYAAFIPFNLILNLLQRLTKLGVIDDHAVIQVDLDTLAGQGEQHLILVGLQLY